jgi:cytochrome c oxidase subunit 3
MAIAVWCAQNGHRRGLVVFLALTLICAMDFLGVKAIEYSHKFHDNLVWGIGFYDAPHGAGGRESAPAPQPALVVPLEPGDARIGRKLFRYTCAGCHGPRGQGLPGSGKPLNTSEFVAGHDDAGLLGFLQIGRMVNEPLNTTGIAMLPRGGNPRLTDQDLAHLVQHLRVLQTRPGFESATPTRTPATGAPAPETGTPSLEIDEEFTITESFIAAAATGPGGLVQAADLAASATHEPLDPRTDPDRPRNAHLFFGIYFLMTGLHGLHVAAGMGVIAWLLIRALRGGFSRDYYTPVDLGGLYWHVVDVIWIFLFPLFYLIH